jgi:hypothetical protein
MTADNFKIFLIMVTVFFKLIANVLINKLIKSIFNNAYSFNDLITINYDYILDLN